MRIRICWIALLAVLAGPPATAQERVPSSLSLADAIEIAERNNPSFLQTRNDAHLADWDVKQAYGQLLPTSNASTGASWQGTGDQTFAGGVTLGDLGLGNQPSYYTSTFNVGLGLSLNWATLLGPKQAKTQREVTQANIRASGSTLVSQVTGAYVEMRRQEEAVRLVEQQLENSSFNLRLARGQLEVGSVTPIDVGQAEVQVGRSEVAVLQSRNALATARMRLLQQLGVPVTQDFTLATEFELTEPTWELAELNREALMNNPTLDVRRRSREVATIGVSSAKSGYLPSLSVSTGLSGFARQASSTDFEIARAEAQVAGSVAQCASTNDLYARLANPLPPLDCSRFVFTDAQRQGIISQNDQFPFSYNRNPLSVSFSLSIPIFQGLSRQRNLEAARLQRDDAVHQVREQELALEADLAIGLANVRTAYQSALLERRNRVLAEQQFTLARERYQLGAITFVELVDAQTLMAQAERDRIGAVYAYHDAVTNLEALVGAPLRN